MKSQSILLSLITLTLLGSSPLALAAKVDVSEEGDTEVKSEQEASKYFRKSSKETKSETKESGDFDHYLAFHLGAFVSSTSYKWGDRNSLENIGRLNLGMTYRIDSFTSLIDSNVRVDLLGYELPEGRPMALSFLFMLMLPEAQSKFPLYFGLGLGPGFFLSQLSNESYLSAHYQVVAGVRFFDVIESIGFFAETGLKNHLFLLSDGQFNGYFVTVGSVFTF
ncbi:MAG: hypothetical protein IT289_00810 [Oligoflexia bacterium]|nr:hypothetical protein [Oligoflexia bacterium]